tara:strand:+ start:295 stop:597 length:303 start_codon:yes stop_codon:yes gene_type:complete
MRITKKQLENKIDWLNKLTGNPEKPYNSVDGKMTANVGNYHLYCAYGYYNLHQMCNEGGGARDVFNYGGTKKELAMYIDAFMQGYEKRERELIDSVQLEE